MAGAFIIRKNMKRNIRKLTILLICLLLVALTLCVLASCVDKPQAKHLTDLELPTLKSNQAAVIIKNGKNDYTSYVVNLDKVGEADLTAEDVLAYLQDNGELKLDWADSTYGKYINAIGGITPDASKNEYVTVLTSNGNFQGTWAGVDEIKVGDVTLKSAAVGVSELGVAGGDVIYFELASY